MNIDWIAKLQHLLQTLAFCLAVSAIQFAFLPDRPWQGPVVYSLFIGLITWALIDFGRHLFASSLETGWPHGWEGLALVLAGIAGGYLLGTTIADRLCRFYAWGLQGESQLRSSILITALAGIAGTYYFYSKNKSAYLENKMKEAREHATEARLKLLETQLEPHMLFNTLANLRALIGTDPKQAQQMLDHMIAYLRATLGASRAVMHPLSAEFDRLRDYLELMAVRMGPRLRFELQLPDALRELAVPPLLLQPLVENSLRHGLEPKLDGGSITVRAGRRDGRTLQLEVIDSGLGMGDAAPSEQGFGLAQVRERLAAAYGPGAGLRVAPGLPQGTHITLTLPLATAHAPAPATAPTA